jgi:predicted small lipoprotein YifL
MCKCWTQWLLIAVIFMFSLMTLLAGCGIKGPIYLPDEQQKKTTTANNTNKPASNTAPQTAKD